MTKQETFDTIVAHLRKQGEKAEDSSSVCVYLTKDGKKCAAGCLIPPDRYDAGFESHVINDHPGLEALMKELGHDLNLVRSMQSIHDNYSVRHWEREFEGVADDLGLTYTPPEVTNAV